MTTAVCKLKITSRSLKWFIFGLTLEQFLDIIRNIKILTWTWRLYASEGLVVVFNNTITILCGILYIPFESLKSSLILSVSIFSQFSNRFVIIHRLVISRIRSITFVVSVMFSRTILVLICDNSALTRKHIALSSFIFANYTWYFSFKLINFSNILDGFVIGIWIEIKRFSDSTRPSSCCICIFLSNTWQVILDTNAKTCSFFDLCTSWDALNRNPNCSILEHIHIDNIDARIHWEWIVIVVLGISL